MLRQSCELKRVEIVCALNQRGHDREGASRRRREERLGIEACWRPEYAKRQTGAIGGYVQDAFAILRNEQGIDLWSESKTSLVSGGKGGETP